MCGHNHDHNHNHDSHDADLAPESQDPDSLEPSIIDYDDDDPVSSSGGREDDYDDLEDEDEDESAALSPAGQMTEEEYLKVYPGIAMVANLFSVLDTTVEERLAGVKPKEVDTYLRGYGFHPTRLEEKREQIREMIAANVSSPIFFKEGAPVIDLLKEPGGKDLFITPESTDAFVALAVALGFAKVSIPNGFPGELAMMMGMDTLTFDLSDKGLFGKTEIVAA